MPLEFRGLAIIDPPERGIRFAGYPTSTRNVPLVICEVTAGALRLMAGLPHASFDELMGTFELHKAKILAIVSAKFDAGEHRPLITERDVRAIGDHEGFARNQEF